LIGPHLVKKGREGLDQSLAHFLGEKRKKRGGKGQKSQSAGALAYKGAAVQEPFTPVPTPGIHRFAPFMVKAPGARNNGKISLKRKNIGVCENVLVEASLA